MAGSATTGFSGARHAAGLGLVVGAGEAAWLLLARPTGATLPERLALALLDALLLGALGGLVGLLTSPLAGRAEAPHRGTALQVAAAALALAGLLAWPTLGAGGLGDVLVGAVPLLVAVAVYGQARFWLARAAQGQPPVGWLPVAGSLAAVTVALSAILGGGAAGPAGDGRSVLLVTVDGLRPGDVGAAGGEVETARLDALAASGTAFSTAIAPSPSTVASHATVLTGLEPLRHHALDDVHALPPGLPTIAGRLAATHATAAFVSSAAVAGVGLEQGFATFDAAFGPAGIGRTALVDLLLGRRLVRRSAGATVEHAARWLAGARGPFFAWVHLERLDDADVPALDAAIGRLVDALGPRSASTLVLVAGSTGDRPGAVARGLGDDRVRVPVVLRSADGLVVPRVDVQVRLVDVAATVLAGAGLPRPDELEGIDLQGFLKGRRSQGATSVLLAVAGGRPLLGLRQDGVKVVLDPESGAGEVFDLASDPGEVRDLAGEQLATLGTARAALQPDVEALAKLGTAPALGAGRVARLRALGWAP